MMRPGPILLSAAVLLASCSPDLPHSNPYDPDTSPSQQARGRIAGRVDTAVLPSGGSELLLFDSAGLPRATRAGADGAFAFDELEPAVYSVELREPSVQPVVRSGLKVVAGETLDLGVLTPLPWPGQEIEGALSGAVALEGGGDASACVVLVERELSDGSQAFVAELPVAADGAFHLAVKPGSFAVTASHPLYLPRSTKGVRVAASAVADAGTLLLQLNPATLQGTVLLEREPDATDASPTEPGSGASVTLDDGSSTTADGQGSFSLGRLLGGSHTFRASYGGYHDPAGARPVLLSAGRLTVLPDPIVLALDRGAIAGVVSTSDGGPIDGAAAQLLGTRRLAPVVPTSVGASTGTFRFESLPVGSYQVSATSPGYVAANGGTVQVSYQGLTPVPPLRLVPLRGAFSIDDGIAGNRPGFAGRRRVELVMDFPGAAELRASDGDPTFQSGAQAFEVFQARYPLTLAPGEGTHRIYLQVRDAAGTPSGVFSESVVVDLTGPSSPQVRIENGASFTSRAPALALTLSASEAPAAGVDATSGLSKVHLSLDGVDGQGNLLGEEVFDYRPDLLFLLPAGRAGEGKKDFWVRFEDGAGNLSDASDPGAHASITVDTLPPGAPEVSIDQGPLATQAGYTDRAAVAVRLSATEPSGSAVLVKLADSEGALSGASYAPLSSPMTVLLKDPAVNERKTIWARFADLAGNEVDASATIELDAAPPTASVSAPGLANGFASTQTVRLSVAAGDAESGLAALAVELSESPTFEGASWTALEPTRDFPLSAGDGPKTVFLRARDKAGNLATASTTFRLDTAPPTGLALLGDGAPLQRALDLELSVSASPDVTGMFVQQDAAPDCQAVGYGPFRARQTVTFTTQGAHAVYVCLRDAAGNVAPSSFAGSPLAAPVSIDSLEPQPGSIAIQGTYANGAAFPSANSLTAGRTVTLTFNPTDASKIAELLVSSRSDLGDATWRPYLPSLSFDLTDGDGPKTVFARFKDEAGNVSLAAAQGAITLHASPPTVGTLKVAGGASATNAQDVPVLLGAQDAAQMRLFVDSVPVTGWVGYTTSTTVPFAAPEGLKTVTVRFRTDTWVEGAEASARLRYDVTPPSGVALAVTGSLGNNTTSGAITQTPVVVASFGNLPADAVSYQLVQAPGGACGASLFGSGFVPVAPSQLFPLLGADGPKKLCAVFKDDAGNVDLGAVAEANIVLDTTPPTNPSFTNVAAGTTRAKTAPAAGPLGVTAVSDNLGGQVAYECLGGQYLAWSACGTSSSLPAFDLKPGTNLLGVRARDSAYNVSAGTLIQLVQDDLAPLPPVVTSVRARGDTVQLSWNASPSGDVVGYRVNYGPSPWDTSGSGAAQGMSPVDAGGSGGFVLTGLSRGSAYYISVVAYDAAGNVSDPSEPRLVIPDKVEVRSLSSLGGEAVAVGSLGAHGYLAQRLAMLQLDLSDDAAAPTTIGRANLPDLVPNQNVAPVAVPCSRGGVAGECVYISGNTLAGEWSADPVAFHAGISVVFYPAGGTAARPVLGVKAASVPVRALLLSLSPANDLLYAAHASGLKVYSLADPLAPALVASASYPVSGAVSPLSMGRVGGTLYLLAQVNGAPQIIGFDVSNPAAGLPAAAYAVPLDAKGQSLSGGVFGLFGGGVFLAYKILDYATPYSALVLSRYTPGAGSYPAPDATLVFHEENFANEDISLTAATWSGTRGYLFALNLPTAEQGWAVDLAALSKRYDLPPAAVSAEWFAMAGVATVGGNDRLLASAGGGMAGDPNPSPNWPLRRWKDLGASASAAPSFHDARGQIFAFADHYLFLAAATNWGAPELIWTVDVSNPLLPRTVSLYTSARTFYKRFLVHGELLYTLAGDAIEIFRIGPDGALTPASSIAVTASDFAVSGHYLFAGLGPAASGVRVWDVSAPATPVLLTTGGTFPVYALDVRGTTVFAAGASTLQSYGFDGMALGSLSAAATLPSILQTSFPAHLSVRGQTAVVSDYNGSQVFALGAPAAAPVFDAQYFVSGPVLQQGGYLVGMAPFYSREAGITFQPVGSRALDGSVPFGACSGFYSSLASSSGVYFASCGVNGVFIGTPVDPTGGKVLKEVDSFWRAGPLASDGMFAFIGGRETVGPNWVGRSFYDDEHDLAGGGSLQGLTRNTVSPLGMMDQLSYSSDGTLFSCEATSPSARTLVSYDLAAPAVSWPVRGSLQLMNANNSSGCAGQVSQDGRWLFAAVENISWAPLESSVRAIDVKSPDSMTEVAKVAAPAKTTVRGAMLYRQKVFVDQVPTDYPPTSAAQVNVLDVSTPAAPSVKVALPISGAPRALNELAIAGDYLFVTTEAVGGIGPYELQVWKLGSAHDGAGARLLGSYSSPLPLSNPVIAGDTLFVRHSSGIATFDLLPLFQEEAMPTFLASQGITQMQAKGGAQLSVDGPFARLLVQFAYRVFDLR